MTPGKKLSAATDVKSTNASKDIYFLARIAIFVLSIGGAVSAFGHFEEIKENSISWMLAGIVLLVVAFLIVVADLATVTKRSMAKI